MKQVKHWQDPVNAAAGAWLIVSPWVLGFRGTETAMVNAVLVAAVILVLALWVLVTDKDYLGHTMDRPAH